MPEITRILCPVDFSDVSRHAIDQAIALARHARAQIVGLYVYTPIFVPVPAFEMAGYQTTPGPYTTADLDAFASDLAKAFDAARTAGIAVDTRLRVGTPHREIVACAKSMHADLIVIGTHGAGGFEHFMLGSVTEKVLRHAPCPVLTVPPKSRLAAAIPFTRILCPVDFSDTSLAIVEFAGSLATESGAEVMLLHVLEWPSDEEPRTSRAFNVPEYRLYCEQDSRERLKALVPEKLAERCTVQLRLAYGKPYREILSIAADWNPDAIVMGVQGRNAIDVMVFGSTTNQVVRRAACPVLTLRQ